MFVGKVTVFLRLDADKIEPKHSLKELLARREHRNTSEDTEATWKNKPICVSGRSFRSIADTRRK